jgi:hypothetical protein
MKSDLDVKALLPAVLAASLTCAVQALAQQPAATAPDDAGRAAGKGPQLMDSPRDDDYLKNRIKMGKEGAMPAFGAAFSDAQIDEIIKYIRSLKPRQG